MDFNEARDDGVAVASAGPDANHLHLTPDRSPRQSHINQFYTGQMLFTHFNSVKALKANTLIQ